MAAADVAPWLGRFLEPLPISAEGSFRITAVRDARSGREQVVVSGAPSADPKKIRAALERLCAAHQRVKHPRIAPAVELGLDPVHVVFDCPARTDLAGLLMIARAREVSIDHGAADGFIVSLRDAIFAAMDTVDPRTGEGHALGALSYGNVLFGTDGRFWLIGLGHNVALVDESGRMGGRGTAFQAPEVAIGARPTRSSEFVALLLFMRSLVPFMRLRPAIVRVLAGNSLAEDFELITKLVWFERRVLTALPETRATVEEAIATSNRIRELLRAQPEPEAFQRAVEIILVEDGKLHPGAVTTSWRVARDGSSLERAGASPIHVPGRGPLRRLVLALATARLERPGASLSVAELLAAGWPGERVLARAGRNRVHVAVSTLRKMGLGSDLESNAGTYRINPSVVVELVEHAAPEPVVAFGRP